MKIEKIKQWSPFILGGLIFAYLSFTGYNIIMGLVVGIIIAFVLSKVMKGGYTEYGMEKERSSTTTDGIAKITRE